MKGLGLGLTGRQLEISSPFLNNTYGKNNYSAPVTTQLLGRIMSISAPTPIPQSLRGLGAAYVPNPGDVVNVLNDIAGKDANGNDYTIKGHGWLYNFSLWPNVVMILSASPENNTLTIDDGTSYSPITATYADNQNSFELANAANTALFKPYAGTIKLVSTVAADTANVVQNAAKTASNTSSIAPYLVPLAITGVALFIGVYAYKNYIKGNDKIKVPALLGHKKSGLKKGKR